MDYQVYIALSDVMSCDKSLYFQLDKEEEDSDDEEDEDPDFYQLAHMPI